MNSAQFRKALKASVKAFSHAIAMESQSAKRSREMRAKELNPAGHYMDWMRIFHESMKPENYLEIGVADGKTLALASNPTRAFGVDPDFHVTNPIFAPARLFRVTSDEFFSSSSWPAILNNHPVALAFIDGLHEYRQVLRDIWNTARFCDSKSMVLVHDVVPLDDESAGTEHSTVLWTGDVFKAVAHLQERVTGLDMKIVRAEPTGLAVLTNTPTLIEKYESLDRLMADTDHFDYLTTQRFMTEYLPNLPNCFVPNPSVDAL